MPLKPPKMEMDEERIKGFLRRVEKSLGPEDFAFASDLVSIVSFLSGLVEKKSSAIVRLLRLIFGFKTESSKRIFNEDSADISEPERPPVKGHGRNCAGSYSGAKRISVSHKNHKAGERCPDCFKGKLYSIDPGIFMRFFATAPIQLAIFLMEKLRCNLCGEIFTADKPPDAGEQKYDESVAAMVAISKYGCGLPFNRLEKLQENCGVPLPAATQWEIVDEAAETFKPVYKEMIRQGAQADIIYQDDTANRVLSLNKGRKEDKAGGRSGVFTTGLVCESEDNTIACFFTGNKHAGENLRDLLDQRLADLSPPLQMCDALSRNMSVDLSTILCNCLTHGRRNFVDTIGPFPEESRHVIEVLGRVYYHDDIAKKQGMSAEQRLLFHQEKSAPLMDGLKEWMEAQLREKLVEPNSGIGKAFDYMLKRWERLTRFLSVAGAPLDTNIVERALKMAIRHRKNSLYYRTERGAWVGDLFMSFIHTCGLMKINAFEYLRALLRNGDKLAADPSRWMPWNYKLTLS
ncbi:MAG: IS66 family transposase, partial [Deltaproteobacteria bacterium]